MKRIYLISPSFFANRGPRRSRNPLYRIQNRRRMNGPSLLLENTLLGLKKLEISIVKNPKFHNLGPHPLWIPAGDLSVLSQMEINSISKCNLTLGPNIDFFNVKILNVISQFNRVKVLVPHRWVVSPIEKILPKNCQVLVWHSGIDTNFWYKKGSDLRALSVFIYFKNMNDVENLRRAENYLRKNDISFSVVKYGSYSQTQFKYILNQATAAIWIGGTESQGLALIESWSMNVATLVLKNSTWTSPDGHTYTASSAPYMSDASGQFSKSTVFSDKDFKDFFSRLEDFSPRASTQETFNLVNCASNLLKVLEL